MDLEELSRYAPSDIRPMFQTAKEKLLAGEYHAAATILESLVGDAKMPCQQDARKMAKELRAKATITGFYKT